ncbi:hypothetical protein LC593_33370 [Nostoc sp. CHAB 5844]|nr:hypothetical protein [Nostoc sp. CHAB 5844]
MRQHDLIKRPGKSIECKICKWTWASKTNTFCPGCVRYGWGSQPPHLKDRVSLHKQNLQPKKGAEPSGCHYSMKRNEWIWFYDEKDCELSNPELPPILQWDDVGELKTVGQLKKINLAPSENIKPCAVAWVWDKDIEWGVWIPLYHEDDCKWNPKDTWITKTQLKEKYLLSDAWIKRIGEPDRLLDNPHYRNAPSIKLYSRKRIEKFLADNAEKYAEWLDKRDRYIAIFEANKDKILAGFNAYKERCEVIKKDAEDMRKKIKEQTKMCLKCASGCSTPQGFLCVIHPMGLLDIPCSDFQERADSV